MALRLFTSLENQLATSVPGCPRPTIEQYVRNSAIEVCEKTLGWRYEQPEIRLTPGVYEYEYETPDYAEVTTVVYAAVNGSPINPIAQELLHQQYPDWPSPETGKRSTPQALSQLDPDHFVIAPVPDNSIPYNIKMFVALKPTLDAKGMDAKAMDELEALIIHGALQHLLALPNKSWTDRELATYHAKQYAYKTAGRRAKTNLGAARASMTVRMRPLA
jgi:hypothetical protein